MRVRNPIFIDFGATLGPYFESLLGTEHWNSVFELVPRTLFVLIFESKSGRLGVSKPGLRIGGIARNICSQRLLFKDSGVDI